MPYTITVRDGMRVSDARELARLGGAKEIDIVGGDGEAIGTITVESLEKLCRGRALYAQYSFRELIAEAAERLHTAPYLGRALTRRREVRGVDAVGGTALGLLIASVVQILTGSDAAQIRILLVLTIFAMGTYAGVLMRRKT